MPRSRQGLGYGARNLRNSATTCEAGRGNETRRLVLGAPSSPVAGLRMDRESSAQGKGGTVGGVTARWFGEGLATVL